MVKVFAGRRFERKNLAPLGINAGHHMLDRAILSRSIHRLEHQQHGPIILGIKHVLKLGQHFDPHRQRFLRLRLILGREIKRVAGIDILQPKAIIRHAEGLGELVRPLDEFFHVFIVHLFTSSSLILPPTPYVRVGVKS